MPRKERSYRIKKTDYNRILVTETLPDETPIIFSNAGLYRNVARYKSLSGIQKTLTERLAIGTKGSQTVTIPFKYKIRKNISEPRQLALPHPVSQVQIKEFYKKYEHLILHFCSRSPISIRSPRCVAGTFYRKASWENVYKYRDSKITELDVDPFTRFSPSFFAYDRYDRLYKFFQNEEFTELEKQFGLWWSMDVSRCFDSIYTHCLSWALKNKDFTKQHKEVRSTFAQEFDSLMQRMNHGETHGIVIGPEVSRVFAELILQSIDMRVIEKLRGGGYLFGVEYSIRRYIDDIFIFANKPSVAQTVYDCYRDNLSGFNLHIHPVKGDKISRPFITRKSRLIQSASETVNEFIDSFLSKGTADYSLIPLRIRNKNAIARAFIDKTRSLCSDDGVEYSEVTAYLIGVLTDKIKKLINLAPPDRSDEGLQLYQDAILVLTDVLFFLYTVSPSVTSSYRMSVSLIVMIRFSELYLGAFQYAVKHRIYGLTEKFIDYDDRIKNPYVEGFISLEAINIFLAARELGEEYLLPSQCVDKLFESKGSFNYFHIVSCLFYVRDNNDYRKTRKTILQAVDRYFSDLSDIEHKAEKACLFLDLMCCPYVYATRKILWIRRFYAALSLAIPTDAEIAIFLRRSKDYYWFVNWTSLDMLTSLERKELKRVY